MELDLGEVRDLAGVVTQARGNTCCGARAVTKFDILYKATDSDDYQSLAGLEGPSVKYLQNSTHGWSKDLNRRFNAFFPEIIQARYVRFVVKSCYVACNMRAEVLLHISNDMFAGKHVFRRCLNTDRYTRVVSVGSLSVEEAKNYSFTLPKHFAKSVDCPVHVFDGILHSRMPLVPTPARLK